MLLVLASVLWWTSAFGAGFRQPEGLFAEERYWEKIHAQQQEKREIEKQEHHKKREQAKASVASLVQAGAVAQSELNAVILGPPPPPRFKLNSEYLRFGWIFLLMTVLFTHNLARHRREAEIRALAGRYLSDGTEAALFEMPAFFESSGENPGRDSVLADDQSEAQDQVVKAEDPLAWFFAAVPEWLAEIRQLLPELGKTGEEAERQQTFLKLHDLVCALKTRANCWTLRPVWQLTSALELLLKRLADKYKEVTPSTIRTVASAVDLLAKLCAPGVRPDLIIHPPISVLAVDDDALCRRAVLFALQKAEMTPDVAENGELAVTMAAEKYYDVIFMDINMPGIDGLEACAQIRAGEKNRTTPVVFVTQQSDFQTRAKSTLVGGTDLMAKPFLMFEITVKALAFSMRKRLELAESLRREVASLSGGCQLKAVAVLPSQPGIGPVPAEGPAAPVSSGAPVEQPAPIVVPAVVALPRFDSVTAERRTRKTAKRFKHQEAKRRVFVS